MIQMEAFVTSTAVVALAEMGDKTQLLAILLAARFGRPWPIIAGIFCATIANHLIAAFVGVQVAGLLQSHWFQIAVALGFIAMGLWTLVPDTIDDDPTSVSRARGGVFMTTLIAFFLVEMGDKTQVATIALGARFQMVWAVAAGTTLGMMLANVPAVWLGELISEKLPMLWLQRTAALLFVVLGLWQLIAALNGF